jgi:Succinylglutamate desuccinylase / Aspartoacylase family
LHHPVRADLVGVTTNRRHINNVARQGVFLGPFEIGSTSGVTFTDRIQIGTPGIAWGAPERALWKASQHQLRSYPDDVVVRIQSLADRYDVIQYGALDITSDGHPLFAIRNRGWSDDRPVALVTGGVHGYETSGVIGALTFIEEHTVDQRFDLLVAPCVSPWAYERVHRWNADAQDPNRSFHPATTVEEAAALMRLVSPLADRVLLHIDLHETTDSDETEFRPSLAARDGKIYDPEEIPDGFYLCGDTANPQLEFQAAIIAAVSEVTHIAPADANNEIIGTAISAPGVILYPMREYGLGAAITNAPFRTLTEVYPDSPRTSPAQCITAQVTAVRTAVEYALAHR